MSTLFVEGSTSLTKAMQYLSETSHNPDRVTERNLQMESNYTDPMRFFMEAGRRISHSDRTKNQIYSVRLSFSRQEFDPESSKDEYLAMEASKRFTQELLKSKGIMRPWLIALQKDGDGGLYHSHIYICNPNLNGKGIPKGLSGLRLQDLNDEVMTNFMVDHDRSTEIQNQLMAKKQQRDHYSIGASTGKHVYGRSVQNAKATNNKKTMTTILKQALKNAVTRDDFLRRIQQQNVYINRRANSSKNDLWLRQDGSFRKSISLEYCGTKARTATLLKMSLEQIDQQIKKNQNSQFKRVQHQQEKDHKVNQFPNTSFKVISLPVREKGNQSDNNQLRPIIHISQQKLLNIKYQELIDLNRKLSNRQLTKEQRRRLQTNQQEVVSQVTSLENVVYMTATSKEIHRQKQVQHQQSTDLEL